MACPRTVTLRITQGVVTADPPNIRIDRNCQIVQFNLVNDNSGTFDSNPIFFPWPVPSTAPLPPPPCMSYTQWPTAGTIVQTGPKQYEANANSPIPDGGAAACYKYSVRWSGGIFDPDIQNEPYPPKSAKEKKDREDKDAQG